MDDAEIASTLTDIFADKKVYIADGHHRYNTALNYREWLIENEGSLDEKHPANFIMLVFASMDDPGCLILPTHRVIVDIPDLTVDALADAWKDACQPVSEADAEQADMILVDGKSDNTIPVRFINRDILKSLEPEKSAAWCGLDVAYLHRYLIDELYAKSVGSDKAPTIHYIKSEQDARDLATRESGIALICKPATMEQLRAISEAGDVMPQKSTYFYPKVATGLTINRLSQA